VCARRRALRRGEPAHSRIEEENCGIERSSEAAVPAGATQEAEDDASVVEVTATDDEFTYEPPKESVARRSFSPTKARRRTSC
jgi:hypothetical protein